MPAGNAGASAFVGRSYLAVRRYNERDSGTSAGVGAGGIAAEDALACDSMIFSSAGVGNGQPKPCSIGRGAAGVARALDASDRPPGSEAPLFEAPALNACASGRISLAAVSVA
jgi:hypothetical protein